MMNESTDILRFHDMTPAAGRGPAQRDHTRRFVQEIERGAIG